MGGRHGRARMRACVCVRVVGIIQVHVRIRIVLVPLSLPRDFFVCGEAKCARGVPRRCACACCPRAGAIPRERPSDLCGHKKQSFSIQLYYRCTIQEKFFPQIERSFFPRSMPSDSPTTEQQRHHSPLPGVVEAWSARRRRQTPYALRRAETPPRIKPLHSHGSRCWCAGAVLALCAVALLCVLWSRGTWRALRERAVSKYGDGIGASLQGVAGLRRFVRSAQLSVLYVVLEDFGVLGTPVFGAAGAPPNASTPHLAALASRGAIFTSAYCQAPICSPSRSSFLTGRRPAATRVFGNMDRLGSALPSLVDFVRAADPHATVMCAGGKIFHEACDAESHGFDTPPSAAVAADGDGSRGGRGGHSGGGAASSGRTNDETKVDSALSLLRAYAANRTRFFLAVGLSATHVMRPAGLCSYRAAQAASLDSSAAALAAVPLPPPRSAERRPPLVTWPNYDLKATHAMQGKKRGMAPSEARLAIASYAACASHVDAQLGQLLESNPRTGPY